MPAPVLTTARLRLRDWCDADLAPFAALNADPHVMAFFPATLDRAQSDAFAARIRSRFDAGGFSLWAVEAPGVAPFLGYVGLSEPRFDTFFTPCLEIGWRLARAHWGRGYATEAARAVLDHAFQSLGRSEIVSFTSVANRRSRHVMERLGMRHRAGEEFDHPAVPEGHHLRRHVLYRISRDPDAVEKVA